MTILHILSSPHSPVHPDNRIDAFSIAVWKFIKHMTNLGWSCIHYGVAGCQVDCETVICLPQIENSSSSNVEKYNLAAGKTIAERKQPGDLILCFYGSENQMAAEANSDLRIIEPSIGYSAEAVFAPFRVFVSYAQMHYYYGRRQMLHNPSWFDAVIYNAISEDEFAYNEQKDDYILYFGRVVEDKGLHIAIQATEVTGRRLIIAGPGSLENLGYKETPKHVQVVGPCDVVQRKILMSLASAIIGPTHYIEPFGNMIAEGYMSGTPAITSDWGGFSETVQQGVTGFRCRDFRDFVNAIDGIHTIKSSACKEWAMKNCEDSVVHNQFDRYLKKVLSLNFYR